MAATSTKLAGVDYVLDHGKRTKAGKPSRRKPTLDELMARNEVLARSQAASDRIRKAAGLEPVPANFYRLAMAAEIKGRGVATVKPKSVKAPARKPQKAPTVAPAPAKFKVRDPEAPRTPMQVYALAARALKVLGHEFPATKGEASELIGALEAQVA